MSSRCTQGHASFAVTDLVVATKTLTEECLRRVECALKDRHADAVLVIEESAVCLHGRVQTIALWRQLVGVPDKIYVRRWRQRAAWVFRNEGEEHFVARDGGLEYLAGERAVQPFCVVHLVSKLELPFNSRDHVELGRRKRLVVSLI